MAELCRYLCYGMSIFVNSTVIHINITLFPREVHEGYCSSHLTFLTLVTFQYPLAARVDCSHSTPTPLNTNFS